jgi:hypothetical protein
MTKEDLQKETGLVIFQPTEFWLKLSQKALDLRKLGVRTTKSKLAARYMVMGFQQSEK